jgi:hypothetical protein
VFGAQEGAEEAAGAAGTLSVGDTGASRAVAATHHDGCIARNPAAAPSAVAASAKRAKPVAPLPLMRASRAPGEALEMGEDRGNGGREAHRRIRQIVAAFGEKGSKVSAPSGRGLESGCSGKRPAAAAEYIGGRNRGSGIGQYHPDRRAGRVPARSLRRFRRQTQECRVNRPVRLHQGRERAYPDLRAADARATRRKEQSMSPPHPPSRRRFPMPPAGA